VVVVEVRTVNGKTFSRRVDTAKGSDRRPMSTHEVIEKFRLLSGKVLSSDRVVELENTVRCLEDLADVKKLGALLAHH